MTDTHNMQFTTYQTCYIDYMNFTLPLAYNFPDVEEKFQIGDTYRAKQILSGYCKSPKDVLNLD